MARVRTSNIAFKQVGKLEEDRRLLSIFSCRGRQTGCLLLKLVVADRPQGVLTWGAPGLARAPALLLHPEGAVSVHLPAHGQGRAHGEVRVRLLQRGNC